MKHDECDLFRIIPREEINRVFTHDDNASANMDYTFLGFEDQYKAISQLVRTDWTIIDLGCAYAPQSYYFTEHKKYIGVDIKLPKAFFNNSGNAKFYEMSIQEFCKKVIDNGLYKNKTFAICNFVPDEDARECVRNTFKNCFVFYPEL